MFRALRMEGGGHLRFDARVIKDTLNEHSVTEVIMVWLNV